LVFRGPEPMHWVGLAPEQECTGFKRGQAVAHLIYAIIATGA
jgi:hypothetical protein